MKPTRNNKTKYGYLWCIAIAVLLFMAITKGYVSVRSVFLDDFTERRNEPVIGFFDASDPAVSAMPVHMRHITLFWKNTSWHSNKKKLLEYLQQGPTLVTVETWQKNYVGGQSDANVLDAILKGEYNSNLMRFAQVAVQSKHLVYLRLDPDMEVPVKQYPWQFQSPDKYIAAYNYVAERIKKIAPQVKIVWGPSGFPGDTEFWPGARFVDVVSITLGSASEKNSDVYPYDASLPQMLRLKLHRMRFINKPVLILGGYAANTITFNHSWLSQQYAFQAQYKNTIYASENYVTDTVNKPRRTRLVVGVFDPNQRLLNDPQVTVEHIFTDWGEIEREDFSKKFAAIVKRRHDAVITVEPWRDTSKMPDTNVLKSTINGRYDAAIKKFYSIIDKSPQLIYLRFAHEMEIPIHRYAWQSQDPVTYINAYRYFMLFDKAPSKSIRRVWGPAGDRGSADWWPGNDVVDYISIAIYGLPDKNITDPNRQEAFSTIFNRKYYRMRFFNRPLFITEFGVKGPEAYQRNWLKGAALTLKNNPHVFGICYFNLYDNPKAWGAIKAPDWSISPRNMKFFCDELNN